MSNEILSVLEYMEKEKGIAREDMISTIATAIQGAATKGVNAGQEIQVEINPRTGALKAFAVLQVVDSLSDPLREVHIENARQYDDNPELGGIVRKEIDPSFLGRIAAQAARQAIMQRVRQFEKDRVFDHYKDSVGDVITGTVRHRDRGNLIVDVGKAEAILPPRERIPGEDYGPGERIRCLLLSIDNANRGPEIILSRAHPDFVRRLIELEVAEIADGTVTIEGVAREPGYRTKICVESRDPKVDPVGACVGARGARVKSIVRELGGEKVDIVRYYSDPLQMLEEAMRPAVPKNVRINERERRIYFDVAEEDLSIAIGRKGQNAKLTSQLMGWRLDISKERREAVGFDARMQKAIDGISHIPGIDDAMAQRLVGVGFTTPEAFDGVTVVDLCDAGFSEEEAALVLEKVQTFHSSEPSEQES
jgi:N utilization substance protein A